MLKFATMMKYRVFFRSLLTIVLLGFMAQTRAEEKKIVVLSDVHVMAKAWKVRSFGILPFSTRVR